MGWMTVLPVNIMTSSMLLLLLFISGTMADCRFNPALFITAPEKMEALSGSCLRIPCNFSAKEGKQFDSRRTMFGVWIKNDHRFLTYPQNVIFNSSQTVNDYPMEIIGNLSQGNCTTLFSNLTTTYNDNYFFRIANFPFMATASCEAVQIEIKDSPWSPTINISGEVKEKKSVTISCSAFTPCPHSPPQLTWNLPQNSHSQIEENTDGTFTSKIQQSITLSDSHDGFNISCSATYPVDEGKPGKTKETQQTLSVPYAPKETSASISPSGLVSAGSWVNLTCSSRANPPVSNFSWFLRTEDGPMKVAEGYLHKLKMTNMTESYYCVATNDLGHDTSLEINLYIPENGQPSSLGAVVGGITGAIVLMSVVFILWRLKSTRSTSHQVQNTLLQEQTRTAENEGIHYGEIDFSKLRPGPSSDSMKDNRQQTDVVYSQVKVCKSSTQTADGPESIYAQVKKK